MAEELQRAYYAIIPANVRYDKDLTPNAKLLYGEITALCNDRGYCWATNDYFSNLYGVSKTSISKWVNSLVQKGYVTSELIYKEGTKQIDNRYLRIVNAPIKEKLNTPIEDKLKENNTKTFNNTTNTTFDKESKRTRFTPPTLEQVKEYCFERNNNVDAERFIDYYTSNGWKVGKNSMKDWKAAVRTWERTSYSDAKPTQQKSSIMDDYRSLQEEIDNGGLFG